VKARVPFWSSLRVRVVLGVTIPLILILGFAAQIQYTRQRELLLANLQEFSTSVGESLETALTRAMLSRDHAQLTQVAQDLTSRNSIRNAMILDRNNVVRVATRPTDIGASIAPNDLNCVGCYALNTAEASRSFLFTGSGGRRVFRNVTPILNQEACQSCHNAEARVLGTLVIDLPLEPIEARLWADLQSSLLLSAAAILVVALIILLLLDRIVVTKLERFRLALMRYARGDFSARVPVSGADEIGSLAATMNGMAEGLEEKAKLEQEVARAAQRLEHESSSLSALYRGALESSRSLNLEEVMHAGLKNSIAAIGMETGEIHLREAGTNRLRLRAWIGSPPEFLRQEELLCPGNCLCGSVAQAGELLAADDLGSDPRVTRPTCRAFGLYAAAVVPLRARGRTLGVMSLHQHNPREFSADDLALLSALGDQLGVAIDNAQLYAEMESRVRELSRQVQHVAVLEERDRLAREMHDGFAQALALLHLKLRTAQTASPADGQVAATLREMCAIVDQTFEDVRQAIGDLRTPLPPPTNFVGSLADYIHTFALRYNLQAVVNASAEATHAHCAPDVEIQVMRIVQETMANVRKHSQAQHVRAEFTRRNEHLEIEIRDDGQGFDPAATAHTTGHFGLAIMRERAASFGGELRLHSEPGMGTTIGLRVPLARVPDDAGA
jgi:two-component system nitrate/nitrite sensor histidine kinase NarX